MSRVRPVRCLFIRRDFGRVGLAVVGGRLTLSHCEAPLIWSASLLGRASPETGSRPPAALCAVLGIGIGLLTFVLLLAAAGVVVALAFAHSNFVF